MKTTKIQKGILEELARKGQISFSKSSKGSGWRGARQYDAALKLAKLGLAAIVSETTHEDSRATRKILIISAPVREQKS